MKRMPFSGSGDPVWWVDVKIPKCDFWEKRYLNRLDGASLIYTRIFPQPASFDRVKYRISVSRQSAVSFRARYCKFIYGMSGIEDFSLGMNWRVVVWQNFFSRTCACSADEMEGERKVVLNQKNIDNTVNTLTTYLPAASAAAGLHLAFTLTLTLTDWMLQDRGQTYTYSNQMIGSSSKP